MADSDQCYIALRGSRCVAIAALEPAVDTAKLVLEWDLQGLSVEVTTQSYGRELLIAGLEAQATEATG